VNQTITLTVNGETKTVTTDPERPLQDVLREDLQLTGTKYGCGDGRCGACTVLLDGKRVHSCLTPVADAHGKKITTIEGLATNGTLHPVQEAFLAEGAMQCGYCTPGMIMTTVALLESNPHPSDEEILEWVDGNLCRCNGYVKILRAIRRAAGRPQGVSQP
jgi:aerobic-type carbon monoxide dehydrogenase small subunit (CoxS/CutS family)